MGATTLKQKAFSCSTSLKSKLHTTVSDRCIRSFAKIQSVDMHILAAGEQGQIVISV